MIRTPGLDPYPEIRGLRPPDFKRYINIVTYCLDPYPEIRGLRQEALTNPVVGLDVLTPTPK